jgi:hypothetical protein
MMQTPPVQQTGRSATAQFAALPVSVRESAEERERSDVRVER